ncbi:MAG: hypothetical protein HYS80_02630, partial [Candidatus Aenigmarchaeota archaeon]|nr:hypothetical protein [Candidatus Aenigmarchaeota archaeon]
MLCVTDTLFPTNPNLCQDAGCSYLDNQSGGIDLTPPTINLYSPVQGVTYNSRSVLLNLTTSEPSTLSLQDNLNSQRGFSTFCSNCDKSYSRLRRFNEGFNNITIQAEDNNGNSGFKTVYFYIDSQKPSIRDTQPDDGDFVSGTLFTVEYSEDNLQSIVLHYGVNANDNQVNLPNCPSGRNQECSIDVNLNAFNNQVIQYYF